MRIVRHEVGSTNFVSIMVSYVPTVHGEQKTKPTQHAVKSIRSHGLIPDIVCMRPHFPSHLLLIRIKIACRCEQPLADSTVRKIALHCQVDLEQIVVVRDMPTIYQVPLLLREQKLVPLLLSKLGLNTLSVPQPLAVKGTELWESWKTVATAQYDSTIDIALVGKYVSTPDAYMSTNKSLEHASMRVGRKLNLHYIDAEDLEPAIQAADPAKFDKAWEVLKTASGIIVPGGFGKRGILGMMHASKWARENKIPYLGVSCTGNIMHFHH